MEDDQPQSRAPSRLSQAVQAPEALEAAHPTYAAHPVQPRHLARLLAGAPASVAPAALLSDLIAAGLDQPPLPGAGAGATLLRWRCLAQVAGHDLNLAKLYEGHTDALAILAELDGPMVAGASWGVWCAEPPGVDLTLRWSAGAWRLTGRKLWCSGAAGVSHALVSCRDEAGLSRLAAVALRQPGVTVTGEGWQAVGMAASASVDVGFDAAEAIPVGAPGAYLSRPGFWHGGAGVAACWYGGARAIADALLAASRRQQAGGGEGADPHRLAHLGQADIALRAAAALLRETAAGIDRAPSANAALPALRARLAVEAAAGAVLHHATRALGAGPLCRDAHFARMAADLPVFLRQSHAERDLAAVGGMLANTEEESWAL